MEPPTRTTPPPGVAAVISALIAGQTCLLGEEVLGEARMWLRRSGYELFAAPQGAPYYRALDGVAAFAMQMIAASALGASSRVNGPHEQLSQELARQGYRLKPHPSQPSEYYAVAIQADACFRLGLPILELALGRWMDKHGAELSVSCALGTFYANVGTKKVLSYGDSGQHAEIREFSGQHLDPSQAIALAFERAFAVLGRPE